MILRRKVESLSELRPLREALLKERGLVLDELVKSSTLLPPRNRQPPKPVAWTAQSLKAA